MAITDNVSVMRAGQVVANIKTRETDPEHLAELMVGRKVLLRVEKQPATPGDLVLAVENLDVVDGAGVRRVKDVSFKVRAGEIVGIAGVAGNGQSELLEALSGIRAPTAGTITLRGADVTAEHAVDAREMRARGMAHVPEDRQLMGLVMPFEANESAILGYHADPSYNGPVLMNREKIIEQCREEMDQYDVRPHDPLLVSANFSGGNQQKIVLAREMERDPDVLLVGQPTRGVDIGAIEFIHRRLIEMRDRGKAVLLVSVELEEVMSLADRILVMFDGAIVGELAPEDADEQKLGLLMAGVQDDTASNGAVGNGAVG